MKRKRVYSNKKPKKKIINIYMNNLSNSESDEEIDDITIKEFQFEQLKPYSTIVFVSPRRGGKSTFIRQLLYQHYIKKQKIKNFLIISPTAFNPDYQFIDDRYKQTELNEEIIENILSEQEEKIANDKHADNRLVIVLDDILKSTNGKTKDILERIFILGRHFSLEILLSVQNIRAEYTPSMRLNTDYVVLYQSTNRDNKDETHRLWLSLGDKDMEQVGFNILTKVPQKYRTLIIDNTSINKTNYGDFCYHFEATLDSVPKKFYFY